MTRRRRRPGRKARVKLFLLLLLVGLVGGAAVLALTGRSVPVPHWVVDRAEVRVNEVLNGQGSVHLGGADLLVDSGWAPRLRLRDVELRNAAGLALITLPDLRVVLSKKDLLRGRLQPTDLRIIGANLTLRRDTDGTVHLDLSTGLPGQGIVAANSGGTGGLDQLLLAVDRALSVPFLARIEQIEAEGLNLTLEDARAGRVWRVRDGRLRLTQSEADISVAVALNLPKAGSAALSITASKGGGGAQFGVSLQDVPAADIATQAAALAWLAPLDAPISGSLRSEIAGDGVIGPLNGTLEIGAGDLRPGDVAEPIRIERGKVYFSYDPARGRLEFADITLDSRALRIRASGHADLTDPVAGLAPELIVQVRFADVAFDPAGLFQEPVRFSQGAVDLRLQLDPFSLSIGQFVLVEAGRRIEGRGRIGADAAGWDVSLDMVLDRIAHDRLLALWPVGVVPLTRNWLDQNVQTSQLFDVKAALRLRPGAEPRLSLGYEFTDTDVRFLKTLPPILQATGYAAIQDNSFALVVDRGMVTPPLGGVIDMAGTVFRVPDITVNPAPAVIELHTSSSITAALSLLNEPPFGFLTRSERPVDVAEGRARMVARIDLPLAGKVGPGDVKFEVAGNLTDLSSEVLVPGRRLQAETMDLTAGPDGMAIAGDATLDGVPFRATWSQEFAPEAAGRTRVEGTVELSQRFLDAFRVGLPQGALAGVGTGQFGIDLVRGQDAQFRLGSDLSGLALRVAEIGWSKPKQASGRLELSGSLGSPPTIDRLSLNASGLKADGTLVLNRDGSLQTATFSRVQVDDWLDGPVQMTGRGANRPVDVVMRGGRVDLRRSSLGGSDTGGRGGAIKLNLDRLVISEGIALTGFQGSFNGKGGFNGSFGGMVNGVAPVVGTVTPLGKRSAVRLESPDAGAVFRAAGVFDRATGGALDMTLTPTGAAGNYDGRLQISSTRIQRAPVLAELLGMISVIGLLEQLNGTGILFNDVQAEFRLTPNAVEIRQGSAIGSSMGVTMVGLYSLGTKQMDMQGVISPIYILNGIGSILTRKGEGLFGFNYQLRGTAVDPRIQVNPLSILTPGMFRELFRRPPPALPSAGN